MRNLLAWHKKRSLQGERERREEKKNCCPSSWFFQFKDAISNKVFFKCFTLWYLFLLKWGLFVNNSSISTQQFNNHTSRVYTVSFTSSMVKHRKSSFFFIKHKLKLNLLYTNIAVKNLSAVSRHPSGPPISVIREKWKKDVLFFLLETVTLVKHIYILRSESRPPTPTVLFCVYLLIFFWRDTFDASF